jgi:hypothetical protein
LETKRTPLLETLVLNVARLCLRLVATGCLPCSTAYPTSRPSALRRTEGTTRDLRFSTGPSGDGCGKHLIDPHPFGSTISAHATFSTSPVRNADLAELDAGEAAAIALAQAHPDALLLMDDAKGRNEAGRRNILTVGTLGILRDAAALGFVDLPTAFARLAQTSFRAPISLMNALLEQDDRQSCLQSAFQPAIAGSKPAARSKRAAAH